MTMAGMLCARQPCRLLSHQRQSTQRQHITPLRLLAAAGPGRVPAPSQRHVQSSYTSRPLLSARRVACAAWFQGKGAEERIAEVVQPRQGDDLLESLQLKREVRERVSDAVEDLGGKVHTSINSIHRNGFPSVLQHVHQCTASFSKLQHQHMRSGHRPAVSLRVDDDPRSRYASCDCAGNGR